MELSEDIKRDIESIKDRVIRLEDAVFPQKPPGDPGENLKSLEERINKLESSFSNKVIKDKEQFTEIIKTLAELRNIVEAIRHSEGGEMPMEAEA